jgi:hypothetical protein
LQDPILKKPFTKIGLVEWLKVKALSSSPSTTRTHTQIAGYKINLQKSVAFLYTNKLEKEYRKITPLKIASKTNTWE